MNIKKIIYLTAMFVFTTSMVSAQTTEEILRLSINNARQHTARVTAMGGAFTSLGADASSLNINPAGLGMYLSSEISMTPSLNIVNSETNATSYNGQSIYNNEQSTQFNLSNLSGIFTFRNEYDQSVKGFTIGISYNRTANFDMRSYTEAPQSNGSISDLFSSQLEGIEPKFIESDESAPLATYINNGVGIWGAMMNFNNAMIDAEKAPWIYSINPRGLKETDFIVPTQTVQRYGESDNFSIGTGFNIMDKIYVGATFGARSYNLNEETIYQEWGVNGNIGDFDELFYSKNLNQNGTSFDFKIGATAQPISGLRIGIAYHAPRSTYIEEEYYEDQTVIYKNGDRYSQSTPYALNSYNIVSSHRLLTGASYRLGSLGIISFDYTLNMNGTIKMKNTSGTREINNMLDRELRNNSEYKIGLEFQVAKGLFVRGGYSFIESAYSDDYLDYLKSYGETSLKNRRKYGSQHYASGGLGYRNRFFFVDIAYQYIFNKVPSYMMYGGNINAESIVEQNITNNMISLSLGLKF